MGALRFRALPCLSFVLEHGSSAFYLAQPVAIPHELSADPELGFHPERGFELQCGLGGDTFLAAQNAADFRHGQPHALRERRLRQAAGLDELLAQDLAGTFGRLRCGNANGKNQAEAPLRVRSGGRSTGKDCGAA